MADLSGIFAAVSPEQHQPSELCVTLLFLWEIGLPVL
jgi:hypothetical protein